MSMRCFGQRASRLSVAAGLLFAVALSGNAPHVNAQEPMPLSGEMFIGGSTPVDPIPPANTHGYFVVTGRAAQELYANMRARPVVDACRPERQVKVAGSLSCSVAKGGRDAECDFSVNLLKGVLAGGRAC